MPDARPHPDPANLTSPALREARERFIALWSQMGSSWGIPRSMAEVHAMLFVHGEPMNTDDVMAELGISRGSASTTLRGLVEWGIISRVHRRGDRKEYFQAELDVWRMFRTIVRERKKREIDPLLESLRECRAMTDGGDAPRTAGDDDALKAHNARLDDLLEFMETIHALGQMFTGPSGQGLEAAAQLLFKAS